MLLIECVGADALDEAFEPLLGLFFDQFELVFKFGRFPLLNHQLVAKHAHISSSFFNRLFKIGLGVFPLLLLFLGHAFDFS